MDYLLQEIYAGAQAAKQPALMNGRNVFLQCGIVPNNKHPEGQYKIKATVVSNGSKVETL